MRLSQQLRKNNSDMQKYIKEKNDELGICYKQLTALNMQGDKNEKLMADSKAEVERMRGELTTLRRRRSPSPKRMRSAGTQSQCTYAEVSGDFQVSTSEEFYMNTSGAVSSPARVTSDR